MIPQNKIETNSGTLERASKEKKGKPREDGKPTLPSNAERMTSRKTQKTCGRWSSSSSKASKAIIETSAK